MKRDEIVEPLLTQEVRPTLSPFTNNQDEALQEDNDEYVDDDNEVEVPSLHDECRSQNRRISGRGSRTVRLGGW